MFLATTADSRFWDSGRKLLFLGEWCRLHDQRERWQTLDHAVLPYPFDDRERLFNAYCDLQPLNERLLGALTDALNEVHAARHTARFWDVVAGLWLREFLEIVVERYTCLRAALDTGAVDATKVPFTRHHVIPRDSLDFAALHEGDPYNAQLYGSLLRALAPDGVDIIEVDAPLHTGGHESRRLLRRVLKKGRDVLSMALLAGSRRSRVVMVSTYFPPLEQVRLSVACGSFPLFETPRWRVDSGRPVDAEARQVVRGTLAQAVSAGDTFERLLPGLIAANLPRIFVEDFAQARDMVRRRFPRAPRAIITANAFAYNDLFKHWTGLAVEEGVPFAILQHGGSYGCARWNGSEDYETRIADRYYTFGWEDRRRPNVIPWSASRLRARIRRSSRANTGDILWVVVSFPRYSYTMYSVPAGPQTLDYLEYQHRFLRAVSPSVRRLLRYRPYPLRYGWADEARLREAAGRVRVAGTTQSMHRQLAGSRLFIGTFNATAFLETFVADVPTVLFWDPRLWELRPEAEAHFAQLRDVGILHDTPEAAAAFVETIYRDPAGWWQTAPVRSAVGRFCDRFARVHDRTLDDWCTEFQRLASAAVPSPSCS